MGESHEDIVPSYATAIEGISALLLSPDEKKVLLIWERGNWKTVTGAVESGERNPRLRRTRSLLRRPRLARTASLRAAGSRSVRGMRSVRAACAHTHPSSGAAHAGESSMTTLGREVFEEVGLHVDASFAPQYIGGWHLSKARDHLVNDSFSVYAVRATSEVGARAALAVPSLARSRAPAFVRRARAEPGRCL